MNLIPRKYYFGDDFFNDFFEPALKDQMKCDIYEKDGKIHLDMDLPGYNKEDVSIEIDNGYLTISAEHNEENEDSDKNYIKRERRYGKVSRTFNVGDVDLDKVKASFDKGILKVTIPKEEETKSKKVISID